MVCSYADVIFMFPCKEALRIQQPVQVEAPFSFSEARFETGQCPLLLLDTCRVQVWTCERLRNWYSIVSCGASSCTFYMQLTHQRLQRKSQLRLHEATQGLFLRLGTCTSIFHAQNSITAADPGPWHAPLVLQQRPRRPSWRLCAGVWLWVKTWGWRVAWISLLHCLACGLFCFGAAAPLLASAAPRACWRPVWFVLVPGALPSGLGNWSFLSCWWVWARWLLPDSGYQL